MQNAVTIPLPHNLDQLCTPEGIEALRALPAEQRNQYEQVIPLLQPADQTRLRNALTAAAGPGNGG